MRVRPQARNDEDRGISAGVLDFYWPPWFSAWSWELSSRGRCRGWWSASPARHFRTESRFYCFRRGCARGESVAGGAAPKYCRSRDMLDQRKHQSRWLVHARAHKVQPINGLLKAICVRPTAEQPVLSTLWARFS